MSGLGGTPTHRQLDFVTPPGKYSTFFATDKIWWVYIELTTNVRNRTVNQAHSERMDF